MQPQLTHIGFKIVNTVIGVWTICEIRGIYNRNTEINRQLIRLTEIVNRRY